MAKREADAGHSTVIVWFRRDLRIRANVALSEACREYKNVIPAFIFDPAILKSPDIAPVRVQFLRQSLQALDQGLRERGGRLILRQGNVAEKLLQLAHESGACAVFAQHEVEPYGVKRDQRVARELARAGKRLELFPGLSIIEPGTISGSSGKPLTVFTPFKRQWLSLPIRATPSAPARVSVPRDVYTELMPTLADLGIEEVDQNPDGGEAQAEAALQYFVQEKASDYAEARNRLSEDGTSRLSKHLHLGTISATRVAEALREVSDGSAKPGVDVFLSEIAWRDFYLHILHAFPHVASGAFRPEFDQIVWENNESHYEAWKEGRTGYPIVDAAMRQMNATAWMHNRGRMIAASFLTKDLLVDWRWGERCFMQRLVDGDQAANNGGWQWAAGTGTDAQPYFRIFNPILQGKKFDPDGTYVRRWIPELAQVPAAVIHEPWKLSPLEKEHLRCSAYPSPIVDHAQQRARAMSIYRNAAKSRKNEADLTDNGMTGAREN